MTPPRVLLTADAVGGVWTYALDLASGLAEAGVGATLAVLGPPPSARQQAAAQRAGVTVRATGLPLDWAAGATATQIEAAGAAVAELARRAEAGLVHLNSPVLAAASYPVPVLGACHSCLPTWWRAVREGPMPQDFEWRAELLRRGMRACDALLAPSAAFARLTAETHATSLPLVVHNGRRRPPAAPLAAASGEVAVFTSGRLWDAGKNVHVIDAAAAMTALPVRAAGPVQEPVGPNRCTFEHLELMGELASSDIREHLRAHPIYTSAARYEPFGLGVLEAAQAGCALVLSDIPTFRELWEDAALFAPADAPASFAAHFERLAADPALAVRLGEAARARAGRYSLDAMTSATLEVYRRLGLETRRERAA